MIISLGKRQRMVLKKIFIKLMNNPVFFFFMENDRKHKGVKNYLV